MNKPLIIYTYAKCSTCRDATRWLKENNIPFEERPIRETPPSLTELRAMLAAYGGGDMRKLFNTSGMDYRAQNLAAKLPKLSNEAAFELLRSNGNLVKRPFVITAEGKGIVGFKPDAWKKVLLS